MFSLRNLQMEWKMICPNLPVWFLSVPQMDLRNGRGTFPDEPKEEVQREFHYVNLNSNESIFLFTEKYADYHGIVEKMYRFFAHQFDSECYFAVSEEIEDGKNLAEEFKVLEGMLEEQFYQPRQHLFFHGEKQEEKKADPAEDSEIMEQITKDIQYKDLPHLRQDFQRLEEKYRAHKQFSDMYIKFVFSGIMKELLDQMEGWMKRCFQREWIDYIVAETLMM